MRLHFDRDDSIYKIFKTIRKVPSYKTVRIFIDPGHDFFATQWWGQEVIDTLEKKGVKATYIVNDIQSKRYFEDLGAEVAFQQQNPFFKFGWQLYNLLFQTKEFHNNLMVKQNYVSYLVLLAELVVIGGVLYMFWGMISPNATIHIKPAYTVESIVYNYRYYPATVPLQDAADSFISLPYHTGSIPFDHTMNINVANLSYQTTEATGTVKITNNLPESISLLANSKLITAAGELFQTDSRVNIPPAIGELPGEVIVDVTALPLQENGQAVGEDGNIVSGTTLTIRNLPASHEDEQIIATAIVDFAGGSTQAIGTVDSSDIASVRNKITNYMYEKRKEVLQEHFNDADAQVLLFDDLITLEILDFNTTALPGASSSYVEGKVIGQVNFPYIKRKDIETAVDSYLLQRPSENLSLYDIDKNSLTFYEYTYQEDQGYYLVPTKVSAIRGYNFVNDTNNLAGELKEKVTGLSKQKAKEILLDYEEIAEADVKISPPRYESLPQVKSRIKISTPLDKK